MQLLRNWLESLGLAVHDTGLSRGQLVGQHIQTAKQGHTMGPRTQCLFYATDFADRLETEIIPALRAGYVVVTDRYIYSLMARSAVRGMERSWLRKLYGFAVKPALTIYLKASLTELLPRALAGGGFDYWESGMDYLAEETMYDCFVRHQSALLREFDTQAEEYGFVVVDANQSVRQTFSKAQRLVWEIVQDICPRRGAPEDVFAAETPVLPVEQRQEQRRTAAEGIRELLTSLLDETE
jgi:dTMP kinase